MIVLLRSSVLGVFLSSFWVVSSLFVERVKKLPRWLTFISYPRATDLLMFEIHISRRIFVFPS